MNERRRREKKMDERGREGKEMKGNAEREKKGERGRRKDKRWKGRKS